MTHNSPTKIQDSRSEGLVCVYVAQGQLPAHVVRARLENAGIPALLRYESLGVVYGITVDGLGEVSVMVPASRAEEALRLLAEPVDLDEADWAGESEKTEEPPA